MLSGICQIHVSANKQSLKGVIFVYYNLSFEWPNTNSKNRYLHYSHFSELCDTDVHTCIQNRNRKINLNVLQQFFPVGTFISFLLEERSIFFSDPKALYVFGGIKFTPK